MTELTTVLNYRHRQAQQASRSSVELFTNLFFKNKIVDEVGYVIRILKNAFSVLIPKYGIEGLVHTTSKKELGGGLAYDAENNSLKDENGNNRIELFMKVKVRIQVVEAGKEAQRSKLSIQLIEPVIEGISVA